MSRRRVWNSGPGSGRSKKEGLEKGRKDFCAEEEENTLCFWALVNGEEPVMLKGSYGPYRQSEGQAFSPILNAMG